MAVTEQINVRLEPGERERVAEAARRSNTTVSSYVRQRLFGRQPDNADAALLNMLAEMKPMVSRALHTIDSNLAEIRRLRDDRPERDDTAVAERARREFNPVELAAIAERLQLAPLPPSAPATRARKSSRA